MSKTHNAGIVTAYGAAVRGGYTGTYEEFCAQQAQYAENARQTEQAVSDVRNIKTSVESAVSVAETHANNANTSATNASNSATQASESASNANQSANNASSSADSASQSASSAQTSANNASTSEQNAHQSAEDAHQSVEDAQDILESVQSEGDTQINRVQAKGDEVLNSIPEDYTQVQKEISEINGSLGTLKADLNIIEKANEFVYASGKFIDINGKLATNEQYAFTDFVPCDTGTQICLIDIWTGQSVLAYAFYDEQKTFISGQNNLIGNIYEITIPSTAAYVRFSSRTTDGGSNTWNPEAYVYNSKTISSKVEALQDSVSEIETDVSELQSNVSNISEKISAITPEDTTFFDVYDFIKSSFVEYVSGMVDGVGRFQVQTDFALTSIKIKVEPNTTYVLEIPGATRNTGTSNDTGIFEENTAYNTLTITKSGDYLTFTTGSDVSYAVIYFYNGTYDMSHGIEGIHLYKDNVKTSTTPTVKMENLPASVKGNAEPLNILIFGDSITDTINFTIDSETDTTTAYSVKVPNNSYTNGQGQLIQYEMWPTLIQGVLNVAELRNYAKAGAHFYTTSSAPSDPRQKLLYQVEVAFNDLTNPNGVFPSNVFEPDIIIIACGINDGNIASGSFETTMAKTVMNQAGTGVDVEATMNAMIQQSTMDAMRYVLMKIKQRFPTALLLYVNPLQQTYSTNEARMTAREELRKMANQYGFINLDGFGEFGVVRDFETQNEIGLLTKDGLHPNDKGQNLYARNIVQAIKRYYFPLDSFNP